MFPHLGIPLIPDLFIVAPLFGWVGWKLKSWSK